MKYLIILLNLIFFVDIAFGIRESRPTAMDSRIRVISYHPDDVIKYTGYYNYQTMIEFSENEEISSITMGDTSGWEMHPIGNRLFLKPKEKDADTNMTIITNVKNNINKKNNTEAQRIYYFELYARETSTIRNPNLAFNIKFLYAGEDDSTNIITAHTHTVNTGNVAPDLDHPEKYNFNYTLSGCEEISPIKIFDDGEFTYLQFRDKNTELPAVFAVDEHLRESMVNYRVINTNMLVIEQVFKKLALKNGHKISCIFNEAYNPY